MENKKQITFDKVALHMLTQGRKSGSQNSDGTFQCRYRGDNNDRCAVGFLISDEDYDSCIEDTTVSCSSVLNCIPDNWHKEEHFLTSLQDIHDWRIPEVWYIELEMFAEKNNLSFDTVKEFYQLHLENNKAEETSVEEIVEIKELV